MIREPSAESDREPTHAECIAHAENAQTNLPSARALHEESFRPDRADTYISNQKGTPALRAEASPLKAHRR
jgi:hypothetical protein